MILRLTYGRLGTSVFTVPPLSDALSFCARVLASWCLLAALHTVVLLNEKYNDDRLLEPYRPVTYSTAPDELSLEGHGDLWAYTPPAFLKACIAYLAGLFFVGAVARVMVSGVWASANTCGRVPEGALILQRSRGGEVMTVTKEKEEEGEKGEGEINESTSKGFRPADSLLDCAHTGDLARLLYHQLGPELAAKAPRVVLDRGTAIKLYLKRCEAETKTQVFLAFICVTLIVLLVILFSVFYLDDRQGGLKEAEGKYTTRRAEDMRHENSVALVILFGFEFSHSVLSGFFQAVALWLSLRCRAMETLLNIFPGLFVFPDLSPLRQRRRGHEPMKDLDALPTADWIVPSTIPGND
uniref:Uncharacterized protein n=1 Tax=Chromera velia CCMP2878 TaxID=1169474 RepID=A0A0G4HEP5_9ALVE|eukprot:Cvel_26655.t1-p1 / transcript=Cvel_26655.t1 / gene=Cvel_26655 / organism=Chromera_velia_CCMP2878 / gene_product=hypothetical protein / transcript_product=hypothetical protein / location=Cvel_scaffold3207:8038-9499(-) / protein_length=353 / sequence_SO=supercontig / SO=protein_coding / is_pseudo=false